jgi:hypothetical protein
MRLFGFLRYNLLTGALIALVITLLSLPFIHLGGRYSLSIIHSVKKDPNAILLYRDLDHDGNSEKIIILKNSEGSSSIQVLKSGKFLFEWHLDGKIIKNDFFYSADYNHDGTEEIYIFTYKGNKIYLNGYDVVHRKELFSPIFISNFKYYQGTFDVGVDDPEFHDIRHDGHSKLYFSIFTGYSKSIRKVFSVDLQSHKVSSTPVSGTSIDFGLQFFDVDNDGMDEIVGDVPAYGNFGKEYPVSDEYMWFLVYNANLNYKFKPYRVGNYPGGVSVQPFVVKQKRYFSIYSHHIGTVDSSFIALADANGHIVKIYKFDGDETLTNSNLNILPPGNKKRLALYHSNGLVEYFDKDLKQVGTYQSNPYVGLIWKIDVDGDGEREEVDFGIDMNHLFISRNDLTDPTGVNFNSDVSFPYFSLHEIGGKIFSFCMNLDKRFYEFKYEHNPLFTYRYLIYASVFLLAFLLVSLIGVFYQKLIKLRYDAEKQIQFNQLRSIELQLNPHFILNILNSIGALYEKKEVKPARIYMGKYSKLLRDTLLSSGQIATKLKAELDFVRNYLELEKFRLNNRFQYSIENSCETESIEIPRLLLFTFVENAIKHGLYPILDSGEAFLEIKCNSEEDAFRVEIKDNGVGRKKAKEMKSRSTGKGLEILEETLKLYDKIYHRKISFSTYDVLPNQENTGTGIVLMIPKS